VVSRLYEFAEAEKSVQVVRIEGDGSPTSQTLELTAHVGGDPKADVELRQDKIQEETEKLVTALEAEMNEPTPGTEGRATYLGLVKATVGSLDADAPVWVLSSFIDTADPVDLRAVAWQDGGIEEILRQVKEAEFHPLWMADRPVTFVRAAPAGEQELWPAEEAYLKSVHTELAKAAGARSVTWVDMPPAPATSTEPIPVVPVSGIPKTPVMVETNPETGETTCTVTATARFSLVNSPDEVELLERAVLVEELRPCVDAIPLGATVECHGYTAWPGALDASGKPVANPDNSIAISQRRAELVAQVLTEDLGVPAAQVSAIGHGNVGAPHPADPASADNAVVIIKSTTNSES
jgi:hypothetical protein